MKILSVDPGAVNLGLSLWEEDQVTLTGLVRLFPENMNMKQFNKKNGSLADRILLRNLVNFAKNSPKWSHHFQTADKIVFESQRLKFTHALQYGLTGYLLSLNPTCEILFFHPFSISKAFKIGGLTRTERKKRIREIVYEKLPHIKKDDLSQDEIDSILNIFYYFQMKKKDFQNPCPFWSCASHKPSKKSI